VATNVPGVYPSLLSLFILLVIRLGGVFLLLLFGSDFICFCAILLSSLSWATCVLFLFLEFFFFIFTFLYASFVL